MCGTNEEERTSGAFAVAPVRIEVSGSYAQDRFAVVDPIFWTQKDPFLR